MLPAVKGDDSKTDPLPARQSRQGTGESGKDIFGERAQPLGSHPAPGLRASKQRIRVNVRPRVSRRGHAGNDETPLVSPHGVLRQRRTAGICGLNFGSPGRTRTANLVVNSHPLCRLSYRGTPSMLGGNTPETPRLSSKGGAACQAETRLLKGKASSRGGSGTMRSPSVLGFAALTPTYGSGARRLAVPCLGVGVRCAHPNLRG